MATPKQKAQAQSLLEQMITADFSRESMENRLDEVEAEALHGKATRDDPQAKANLLTITGEIRRLLASEPKLAAAGLLAGRRFLPYSKL